MYINSTLKDKSTWDRQLSLRSSQVHWVSTHWGLTWAQVGPGSHYCQSNQVCKVSMILDLWRPLGWTTTVTDRQTATSFNQPPPQLVFGQIRIRRKLKADWLVFWSTVSCYWFPPPSVWVPLDISREETGLLDNKQQTDKQHLQSDSPVLILDFLSGLSQCVS